MKKKIKSLTFIYNKAEILILSLFPKTKSFHRIKNIFADDKWIALQIVHTGKSAAISHSKRHFVNTKNDLNYVKLVVKDHHLLAIETYVSTVFDCSTANQNHFFF